MIHFSKDIHFLTMFIDQLGQKPITSTDWSGLAGHRVLLKVTSFATAVNNRLPDRRIYLNHTWSFGKNELNTTARLKKLEYIFHLFFFRTLNTSLPTLSRMTTLPTISLILNTVTDTLLR